jgi:ribosomal protein S18 acetylase RimI-like enzyme
MVDVSLRALDRCELRQAACLLGRGMRDNPVNVRAFGPKSGLREKALQRFFEPVVGGLLRRGSVLAAVREKRIVGVCGMAGPGRCQATFGEKLRILPTVVVGNGVGVPLRVLRWTGEWARRDPAEPHWHLGPVAVDPDLQGQGIGSAMLEDFCLQMGERHTLSYLETDKTENVRFYERFGYTVVAEALVLDVPNWFMMRRP